jgi:hypothetical protein
VTQEGADNPRDAERMALCAIRYTIGRRSDIVGDGQRWAREWGARSVWVRDVIQRDLRDACDRQGALGDEHDEAGWRNVLTDLDNLDRTDADVAETIELRPPIIYTIPSYQPATPGRWLRRPELDSLSDGSLIAWEILPDAD